MDKRKAYLIGKNVKDRYLKEVYEYMMPDVEFKVKNLKTDQAFDEFLDQKDFYFVVVDHPYKERIIDYLDKASLAVRKCGSCNLVVNKGGILKGFNTEIEAFKKTIKNHGLDLRDKNVGVIGEEKDSKFIRCVLEDLGAYRMFHLAKKNSRRENECPYGGYESEGIKVIINNIPAFSKTNQWILFEPLNYPKLETYINLSGQDFRTPQMAVSKECGIGIVGTIDYLLENVKMSILAVTKSVFPSKMLETIKVGILTKHLNLVVVSLPTCEKERMLSEFRELFGEPKNSNVGALISTDALIEKVTHKKIRKILEEKFGDELYQTFDASIVNELEFAEGRVIFVGHETILDLHNYIKLSRNGYVIYLKKTDFGDFKEDKKSFVKSQETLKRMYKNYNPTYERRADLTILSAKSAVDIVKETGEVLKYE